MSYNPSTGTMGPRDHGWLTWSFPVTDCNSTAFTPVAGQVTAAKVYLPQTTTVTNVILFVSAAGTALTSGQNFMGLYSAAGNLLSATADQTTAWGTTGLKPTALTTAQTSLAAGYYYVAMFANNITSLTLARCNTSNSLLNAGLTSGTSRFATGSSSNTTVMPSTMGTLTSSSNGLWAALS